MVLGGLCMGDGMWRWGGVRGWAGGGCEGVRWGEDGGRLCGSWMGVGCMCEREGGCVWGEWDCGSEWEADGK